VTTAAHCVDDTVQLPKEDVCQYPLGCDSIFQLISLTRLWRIIECAGLVAAAAYCMHARVIKGGMVSM